MPDTLNIVLTYLLECVLATSQQLVLILGPLLVYGILMNYISGFVERRAVTLIGGSLYLRVFAWLGTAVHELGHALFCIIFRHRITELVLFRPDPVTGTLGYVNHAYDRSSTYQRIGNLFIGIGPILLGSTVLYLAAVYLMTDGVFRSDSWLLPPSDGTAVWTYTLEGLQSSVSEATHALRSLFKGENLGNWRTYAFLYLAFAIGSSIRLSPPDIRGAADGFGALIIALFLLNLATLWILENWIYDAIRSVSSFYSRFYSIMVFGIAVNVAAAIILLLTSGIAGLLSRRRPW